MEEEKVDTKAILKASKQPEIKKTVKFLDEATEVVNEAKLEPNQEPKQEANLKLK